MTEQRGELTAEFFRGLVDHLSDLVIVIDGRGGVRYSSDAGILAPAGTAGATDRSDPAGTASSFFDLIHPDDRRLVDEAIDAALRAPGPTIPVEMRAAGRSGWRTLELVAGNLLDDPDVHGVLVAVRDLSRRHRLADEEGTERLRALLDAAGDLTLLTDAQQTIRYASTVSRRILGVDAHHLVGQPLSSVVHLESQAVLADAWDRLLRAPDDRVACDLEVTRADGTPGILAAHLTNFLSDPAVAGVAVAARDVTDVRRAESLLEEFGQQFEHSPHGLARLDDGGRFHEVNQTLRALTGRDETALAQITLADIVHPADVEVVRDFLRAPDDTAPVDVRLLRPDGQEIWSRLTATMVRQTQTGQRLLSVQVDDINDHRRLEETLRERNAALAYRATHDGLTGLPNRQLFIDRVGHALDRSLRHHTTVAVLFCDLDHFKVINDTFGHAVGDQLLMTIAEEMGHAVRPGDTISRFGGDEFVVLAEDLEGPDDAGVLAGRLLSVMTQPLVVEGRQVDMTMSIGVAVATGLEDPAALIASADTAMYRA
ncbi:MAG: diguanylate cyclase, partial [Acidimicrobiales bacterium]|nr:diguanylate cyclase [Acidimicrobiales bacterium]